MAERSPLYFCNGRFVPARHAALPVNDLGLIRSFALFESLRTYNGRPFLLEEHLRRLFRGARQAGIPPVWSAARLRSIIARLLARNRFPESLLRLILTGGPSASIVPTGRPSLVVMVDPFHPFPERQYAQGIALRAIPAARIEPGLKTTGYFPAVTGTARALREGFDEAVYVDADGAILEGTTYNVFAVLPGPRLVTAREGVLPGITADCVLRLARRLRIPVERRPISPALRARAREMFITSSNRELIPVARVDRWRAGRSPGPVTLRLHAAYRELVQKECGDVL